MMIFEETPLLGAYTIDPEPLVDDRGAFLRLFCRREFEAHGLNTALAQCSMSYSRRQGTLRGLHYQRPPHAEVKLVRVTRGAVFDVIVDLRSNSHTFKRWYGVELTAENRRMLYVPEGFAHGIQTLQDDTELFYQMSEFHHPESAAGVRWDDPAFRIVWPSVPKRIMHERDRTYPDFLP